MKKIRTGTTTVVINRDRWSLPSLKPKIDATTSVMHRTHMGDHVHLERNRNGHQYPRYKKTWIVTSTFKGIRMDTTTTTSAMHR